MHSADEFIRRTQMAADRLRAETASDGAKVMNFVVDPCITGVPHRIHLLEAVLDDLARRPEVVFMQGRAILDWYLEATHDA